MSDKWYGWAGTTLRVDLTKGKVVKQPLTKELAYNFLGGRGFNVKALWDEIKPGIDPLSPENILCIGVGPLNGTVMPLSGRFNVSCKSPLTGILGDGNLGGCWSPELKFAGYDQIVVSGRSQKPVYLWINDDIVEVRDASHLWGTTTWETEKILNEEHGIGVQVCGIGQAGENLVRTSGTIANMFRSGSPGSGAVWGSKNLKAIAVRGTTGVKIARPDEFLKSVQEDHDFLVTNEYIQGTIVGLGTPGYIPYWGFYDENIGFTRDDLREKVGGEVLLENYVAQLHGCFNCMSPCGRYYNIDVGRYAGTRGKAPEGGLIIAIGTSLGILNWPSLLKLCNLCNQYSLHARPTGDVIELAMELYKKGIITRKDTDGIPLELGNEEAVMEMVHKIALRDGFGSKLAEGPYNFANIIGKGAEKLASHTYGLPHGYRYVGPKCIGFMTSTRGADHLRGVVERYPPTLWKGRGLPGQNEDATILGQHEWVLADSLERCKCAVNTWAIGCPLPDPLGVGRAKMLSAATGWDVTPTELDKLAERVYNIERAFNVREGASRKYDWPPWKSFNVLVSGSSSTTPEECNKMLDNYYRSRGWDLNTGIPTRKKLEELGLKYVADELEAGAPFPEWTIPPLWPLEKYPHGSKRAAVL